MDKASYTNYANSTSIGGTAGGGTGGRSGGGSVSMPSDNDVNERDSDACSEDKGLVGGQAGKGGSKDRRSTGAAALGSSGEREGVSDIEEHEFLPVSLYVRLFCMSLV